MARRYTRREFLVDASFAFSASVLLSILAPDREVTNRAGREKAEERS